MAGLVLYTPEVLALATGLASYPFDPAARFVGEARSPTCGSAIKLSLELGPTGGIAKVGIAAHACAIGQASAMLFAQGAAELDCAALELADRAVAEWLSGAALPDWPGFAALAPARAYPARHGAIRLPWKAALAALASANARS